LSSDNLSPRYLPLAWSLPELTEENRAFFTSRTIALQKCRECEHVQHPPEEMCRNCGLSVFDYVEVPPRGKIVSFTIAHHPMHPLLKERVPYNVSIVSLHSHPHIRVVGNVIDLEPGELRIGLEVEATWAEIPAAETYPPETLYLPQWKVRQS
jgi:uncharacterized protein